MAKQINIEAFETLKNRMDDAPEIVKEKRTLNKQEAIKGLKRQIEGMQKRGYSLEDIAKFITDGGLPITTPTLKSYIQRTKVEKPKGQKQETKKPEIFADAKKENAPAVTPKKSNTENKGGFTVRPDSDI